MRRSKKKLLLKLAAMSEDERRAYVAEMLALLDDPRMLGEVQRVLTADGVYRGIRDLETYLRRKS